MTTVLSCELQSSPRSQGQSRAQTHRPDSNRKWGGKGRAMHAQFLKPKSYQCGKSLLSPTWVRGWNEARSITLCNTPSNGWKDRVGHKCLPPPQHPQGFFFSFSHWVSLPTRGVGLPVEERDVTVRTWDPACVRTLHAQHTLLLCRYSWHHWPQKVPNWAEPYTNTCCSPGFGIAHPQPSLKCHLIKDTFPDHPIYLKLTVCTHLSIPYPLSLLYFSSKHWLALDMPLHNYKKSICYWLSSHCNISSLRVRLYDHFGYCYISSAQNSIWQLVDTNSYLLDERMNRNSPSSGYKTPQGAGTCKVRLPGVQPLPQSLKQYVPAISSSPKLILILFFDIPWLCTRCGYSELN